MDKYTLIGWSHSIDPDRRHTASVTVKFDGKQHVGEDKGGSEQEAYLRAFWRVTGLTIREERHPEGSPNRGKVQVFLSIKGKSCVGDGTSYPQAYIAGINAWAGPEENLPGQRQSVAEALALEGAWRSRDFIPE